MAGTSELNTNNPDSLAARLRRLTPAQVLRVDELLTQVGEYGEVRLIVQHGQLRFINKTESFSALDNTPPPKK